MKILLYIILLLFAFLVFLLLSKIKIHICYDGNIKFGIKFLFIKFIYSFPVLYKEKNSEVFLNGVTSTEKANSENKNHFDNNLSNSLSKKTSSKKDTSSKKAPFPGIKNTILFFKNTVISLLGKIIKSFRLEKLIFKAVAGGKDASSIAVLYGYMCTAASSLHQFASNAKGMNDKNVYIEIIPDFLAETSDFYAEIRLSIKMWRALFILKKIINVIDEYKNMAQRVHEEKIKNIKQQEDKKDKQPT